MAPSQLHTALGAWPPACPGHTHTPHTVTTPSGFLVTFTALLVLSLGPFCSLTIHELHAVPGSEDHLAGEQLPAGAGGREPGGHLSPAMCLLGNHSSLEPIPEPLPGGSHSPLPWAVATSWDCLEVLVPEHSPTKPAQLGAADKLPAWAQEVWKLPRWAWLRSPSLLPGP